MEEQNDDTFRGEKLGDDIVEDEGDNNKQLEFPPVSFTPSKS